MCHSPVLTGRLGRAVYVWCLWGQGAELPRVEHTQPLIITDSKQLVLEGLFSSSKIETERSLWIMQELQRGRKSGDGS